MPPLRKQEVLFSQQTVVPGASDSKEVTGQEDTEADAHH